jgi:hypothetical protein
VWGWLAANQDREGYFNYAANEVFDAMFLHSLDTVVGLFGPHVQTASPGELRLMASLFREAHNSFVFAHSEFVIRFLERCAEVDPDLAQRASQSFFSSAISGVRSGVVGEPTPQDVEQLTRAKEVLGRLSIASSAYELYEWIRDHAERDIAMSCADGEALADE